MRDIPIDSDRKQQSGNLVPGQETINCPAGALFIRITELKIKTQFIIEKLSIKLGNNNKIILAIGVKTDWW